MTPNFTKQVRVIDFRPQSRYCLVGLGSSDYFRRDSKAPPPPSGLDNLEIRVLGVSDSYARTKPLNPKGQYL